MASCLHLACCLLDLPSICCPHLQWALTISLRAPPEPGQGHRNHCHSACSAEATGCSSADTIRVSTWPFSLTCLELMQEWPVPGSLQTTPG